jgi:hypothetical protein
MNNALIYITRGNLPEDFEDAHHEWYARKHAPEVLGAGFWSARGYDAEGIPKMCNIYEVPNLDVFSSTQYREMRKNDPFVPIAVSKLHGLTASVYSQIRIVDRKGADVQRAPTVSGKSIGFLRFDDEDDARVKAWFQTNIVNRLKGVDGLQRIRLLEQRQQHPLFPRKEPQWCVFVEWESKAAREGAKGQGVLDAAMSQLASKATAKTDGASKRFGLKREDVFEP